MSIEWLTGVSQVLGSRPDVFSCELKIHLRLWCIHCVRTILSPACAIPSLIFHYQCVCSCVCIWCWLLCRCACESERVLCEEAKCSNDRNTFKLLGGYVSRVTDWCVTGPGFVPRCVQLWIKNRSRWFRIACLVSYLKWWSGAMAAGFWPLSQNKSKWFKMKFRGSQEEAFGLIFAQKLQLPGGQLVMLQKLLQLSLSWWSQQSGVCTEVRLALHFERTFGKKKKNCTYFDCSSDIFKSEKFLKMCNNSAHSVCSCRLLPPTLGY